MTNLLTFVLFSLPFKTDDSENQTAPAKGSSAKEGIMLAMMATVSICAILMVGELASLVSFAKSGTSSPTTVVVNSGSSSSESATSSGYPSVPSKGDDVYEDVTTILSMGVNVCEGKKPDLPNVACLINETENVGPQAGGNVTKGFNGTMEVDHKPITTEYWRNSMCPVNVHWHLGAEHLSIGEYDETGDGPQPTNGEIREGHQCTMYDANDEKFTKPYEWKYCKEMEVGQTYEVHWPHSAAGACGTPNQYQTPFYDGVFCIDNVLTATHAQIGVQAQVFIVVNDESYFWPDLMRGMIVDSDSGMGTDLAMYTGSTTGDARSNEICSQYTPITWQVDRKCHMMSASAFDKLCYDMLQQRDDMSDDTHPHGSRETVADYLTAANHANRRKNRA